METFISTVATVLIAIPILAYLLIFVICKSITKRHKRSVHLALDGSTVFFIIAVYFLMDTIWRISFLWLIILLMIFIAMIVTIVHWKVREEIDFKRVLKAFWRLNFLVFFFAYIILILIGMIKSIVVALS